MATSSANSVNIQAQIDRAFQSNNLQEYLTAIAQCGQAIRDNPFPSYVNSLLLRLADVFLGDKLKLVQELNVIRLRIVKLLKECEADLAVASSSEDVVRRIMKVSHSNDYKARSLAMLFLASASPVVYANKKVHHLLSEGLDCKDELELLATIKASGCVGHLSSDFSSVAVNRIGDLIFQEEVDMLVKVELMENLAVFQENYSVTKYCMELAKHLLEQKADQKITMMVINALTSLVKRNGFALSEHVTLVLDEITRILTKNEDLLICCLTSLLSLAESSHHWDTNQIMRVCQYRDNVVVYESNQPLILWLKTLNLLVRHANAQILLTTEFFDYLVPLSTIQNFTVKIHLLDVFYWHLQRIQSQERNQILFTCLGEITGELIKRECAIGLEDRSKFYKMITMYIRNNSTSCLNFNPVEITSFLTRIDDSYPEEVFVKTLETLNLIGDIKADTIEISRIWALKLLKKRYGQLEQKQLVEAPLELFSLALRPTFEDSSKFTELITEVKMELAVNKNWWFAYKLARQGFRYGHFSNIALPLLEQIHSFADTVEASSFIRALIHLSKTQLPERFSPLTKSSKNSQCFAFASKYIDCLYELYGAFNTILVTLNSNMGYLPTGNKIHHMEYIKISFDKAREEFHIVRQKWNDLLQRSFDADEVTQQQLDFLVRYCSLFESILSRLFAPEATYLNAASRITTLSINLPMEQLLIWGTAATNQYIHAVTGPLTQRVTIWRNNFISFSKMFYYLARFPIYIPRAFFQQICRTKIRLHVTPQPKEQQALSLSTKQLALSVEGVIETNNPKSIQNITVYVRVYMEDSVEPKIVDSRLIQLFDNYFKVNFLLTIEKSAEIVTSVRFTDSMNKQTWEANEENRFNVNVSVPTQ